MPTGRRIRKRRVGLKLVWAERAIRDLEKIDDYIAEDSPAAAARWVAKLIATAATIPSAPRSGRMVPEQGRADIREVLLRHYRIVHRIRETRIDILTVFEGHKLLPSSALPEDD
jgi:plasmid stabilization system protein ParE